MTKSPAVTSSSASFLREILEGLGISETIVGIIIKGLKLLRTIPNPPINSLISSTIRFFPLLDVLGFEDRKSND